ncbi:MAG: hypothetical protein UW17_C0010G0002 [Candidatus Nomurabacteria bacterium GW2011_GWD1_44_10]|nr:MAG: hypothetical protein UW17_C0010G0002 [Candidatus Nomurabacteria bacterium GW2011_GWD1_44_10]
MLIRPDQSSVFMCSKCGFRTSGIIPQGSPSNQRWCPDCNSPLFQCNHCCNFTSGTIVGTDVSCDSCKKIVKPEALVVKF